MDPQQAPAPANRYDYILNTQPARKRPFSSKSPKLMSIVFVLFILLLVIIALSLFKSLTKKDYSSYVKLAQQQAEILRVTGIGLSNARSSDTKNYVSTLQAVTTTEQTDTLAFLKQKGIKVSAKQLKLLKDASTDSRLSTAQQTSTYDETLIDVLRSLDSDYYTNVGHTTAAPVGTTEKALAVRLKYDSSVLFPAK